MEAVTAINTSIKKKRSQHLSALLNHSDISEVVLGAKPPVDKDGWSAIHLAAATDLPCMRMLVNAGADPNALGPVPGLLDWGTDFKDVFAKCAWFE